MRIGRGPATVIGRRSFGSPAVSQDTRSHRGIAGTLREKECGLAPHSFWSEAFLLRHLINRRTSIVTALAALFVVPVTAQRQSQPTPAQPATPAPVSREVTDEVGRRIKLPETIQRIVSLAPNMTETVYALGAQDRLVGVTDYCDYPPEAQSKPKVGGAVSPSLEHIVAMKPDLVLASARVMNRRETVDALERLGLAVFATDTRTVENMLDSTQRIAEIIGVTEASEKIVRDLRARLDEVKRRVSARAPRRVLFIVWHEPLVTIGRNTFIADALRWAGAESIVETTEDWPQVSLEEIVRLQPEYIVFAASHSEGVMRTWESLRERPGWRELSAIKDGRYAIISEAVNRPAPRLVQAIEQLARQLHPEAFEEKSPEAKPAPPGAAD